MMIKGEEACKVLRTQSVIVLMRLRMVVTVVV